MCIEYYFFYRNKIIMFAYFMILNYGQFVSNNSRNWSNISLLVNYLIILLLTQHTYLK